MPQANAVDNLFGTHTRRGNTQAAAPAAIMPTIRLAYLTIVCLGIPRLT